MRAARRAPLVIDREAALRLMTASGPLVDAVVRKRPLFAGVPFTLPGREDCPG
jgi:hypothetical protein